MTSYPEDYLDDVVENQGKLFDFVAQAFPHKSTEDFIAAHMTSKTRKYIDECQAYVNTMSAEGLWEYFTETERYELKNGKALEGIYARLDWRVLRLLPVVLQHSQRRSHR